MMNKCISLVLSLVLVFNVFFLNNSHAENTSAGFGMTEHPDFQSLDDPALRIYIEDTLYETLVNNLDSEDYFVQNVSAIYISQDYLDELEYNSRINVFFGYTLSELEAQFKGNRYIFTLGENNKTVVEPWEDYVDPMGRVIHNVAVGTGVILVCVTVSVVTAGTGATACSMIFAMAAKGGAIGAMSGAAFGSVSAGIVKLVETGNVNQAYDAALIGGSEGYKWGAISGAIAGGASEAIALKGATCNGLTMNEAAWIQRESGYPLDVIKGFKTVEQYEICRDAGLSPYMVDGKMALIRQIDIDFTDELGRTNLERMQEGLAALDPMTGQAFQLHHIGQEMDSTLAILSEAEHMQGGNNLIWHEVTEATRIDRYAFRYQREAFWQSMSEIFILGGF